MISEALWCNLLSKIRGFFASTFYEFRVYPLKYRTRPTIIHKCSLSWPSHSKGKIKEFLAEKRSQNSYFKILAEKRWIDNTLYSLSWNVFFQAHLPRNRLISDMLWKFTRMQEKWSMVFLMWKFLLKWHFYFSSAPPRSRNHKKKFTCSPNCSKKLYRFDNEHLLT